MERLKETLSELHSELSSGRPVDPETQELLKKVSTDIQDLLEQADSKEEDEASSSTEKETLLDQMLNLTEEFEESHPELAQIIGRVASALSRIGI